MTRPLYEIKEEIYKEFGERWNLPPDNVKYIYWLIEQTQNKYGKVSRILIKFNVHLSSRQIRYFGRKMKFMIRLGGNKPENYTDLLRKET